MTNIYFDKVSNGKLSVYSLVGEILLEREFSESENLLIDLSDHIGLNLINIYFDDGSKELVKLMIF